MTNGTAHTVLVVLTLFAALLVACSASQPQEELARSANASEPSQEQAGSGAGSLADDGSSADAGSLPVDGSQADAGSLSGDGPNRGAEGQVEAEEASDFMQGVRSGGYQTIRLVGDSITAGFGTDGYEDPEASGQPTVIYDDGMGTQLHEPSASINCWANAFRAWAELNGVREFTNAGICGWFMHQLAQNPDAWLGQGADVIVVALGTNDAGYYGPQEFEDDARVALAAAEQRCKLVVVLSPVADLRPTEQLVEPASELGDILGRICEERGYVFVDTRAAVTPELFCEDGLHPNTAGSAAIWACIQQTLGLT